MLLTTRIRAVGIAGLLSCLPLVGQPRKEPTTELVQNPSFEAATEAAKNRKPKKHGVWKVKGPQEAAGWSLNDAHPGTLELVTSGSPGARTGARFVRIEAHPKRPTHIYQRTSSIRPKGWYLFCAWARGGPIELVIYEYSAKGWSRSRTIVKGEGSEGRWTRVWALYQVPAEDIKTLGLAISVPGGSTTEVDDVSFRPVAGEAQAGQDGRTVMTIPEQMTGPPGEITPPRVPGVTEELLGDDLLLRSIRTNVFHYKLAAAQQQSTPITVPLHGAGPEVRELICAECAAFGLRVPAVDGAGEAVEKYRGFISSHPRFFQGLKSAARVGILFDGDGGATHVDEVGFVVARLGRSQVPFEIIPADRCEASALASFSVVVIPCMVRVKDAAAEAVAQFVRQGGTVALSGDAFSKDEKGVARPSPLLDGVDFVPNGDANRCGSLGQGSVFHVPGQFDDESLWRGLRQGIPTGPILPVRRVGEPLRVNALATKEGSVVLHFVNYGNARTEEQAVMDLPVLVRAPLGGHVAGVMAYTPGCADAQKIAVTQYGDQVVCRIPEIRAYLVLEIRFGGIR